MRPMLAALLALLPAAAMADVVPLRRGVYVQAGTPCADPPFAAMRDWDGIGLADPHSHACHARLIGRRGPAYLIANRCIGTGVGPGVRTTERLTITPLTGDAARIGGATYRFCPPAALPPELRRRGSR